MDVNHKIEIFGFISASISNLESGKRRKQFVKDMQQVLFNDEDKQKENELLSEVERLIREIKEI